MDRSANDPRLCFDALSKQALKAGFNRPEKVSELSGEDVALKFAQQAAQTFSGTEFAQLISFLDRLEGPNADSTHLKARIETALQDFYCKETALSGQDAGKLARPGEALGADLGLVLHLETKDDNFGRMFHEDSATIVLLQEKGVQPDFTFGMDWHWRGETKEAFSRRRTCQFQNLGKAVQVLHDDFSWQILEMVPAPFIVTGSACARNGIRRRLPSVLPLTVDTLEFDIDIRPEGIRRIYLHLPHPTAGFFTNELSRESMANKLDAGWNFSLWLMGKFHSPDTFRKEYGSVSSDRITRGIPWVEAYKYRGIEEKENRTLQLHEYSRFFLRFAANYLEIENENGIDIAERSLVELVLQKMKKRLSIGAKTREEKKREEKKRQQEQRGSQPESEPDLVSVQGSSVHLTERGAASIKRENPLKKLKFRVSEQQAQKILGMEKGMPLLKLTRTTLELCIGDETVYTRLLTEMAASPDFEDWRLQIKYETCLLGETLLLEPKATKKAQSAPFLKKAIEGQDRRLRKGRCTIHGIEFNFKDAVEDSVYLQADLVAEGIEHDHPLCADIPEGDPGRRLGIKSKYNSPEGSVERWEIVTGNGIVKKVNSLVDLLEGRHRDWIAEQSRRYLHNHNGQQHWYSD